MNLATVYNHVSKAYELSLDPEVLSNLQVALTEISTHMDKEKERVKKYRSKDYVKPDHDHSKDLDAKGRCKTCGTPVSLTVPTPTRTVLPRMEEIIVPMKPKVNPIDDALAEVPKIAYEGVMDDLEGIPEDDDLSLD